MSSLLRALSIASVACLCVCHAYAADGSDAPSIPQTAPPASWLDKAWTLEDVNETGGPSITLNSELGVFVVLPAPTLKAALSAGLTPTQAVTQFLERYGQHCSDVLDLDQPHPHLAVKLSLSRATELPGLFVTDDEEVPLVIDYVPTRRAHCVTPDEDGPTS